MWNLPMPEYAALATYEQCTRGVRDADLRMRLDQARSSIGDADVIYKNTGVTGKLSDLAPEHFALPNLSSSEISRIYDGRLAAKKSPGRDIYNGIRSGSRKGKCPLCGHRDVATLDHYLPKSSYPALALNPVNLLPACTDCNKIKQSTIVDTLHPYFDNVETELWLQAEVVEQSPAAVRFYPVPPASWPISVADKVQGHFKVFNLGPLYSAQAARVIVGIRGRLVDLAGTPVADLVRNHLQAEADSWRLMDLNCWEAALYEALAESQWFCETGFKS